MSTITKTTRTGTVVQTVHGGNGTWHYAQTAAGELFSFFSARNYYTKTVTVTGTIGRIADKTSQPAGRCEEFNPRCRIQ